MSSTFTAVDLSRLPAPDVIEQIDFEVLLASALANLRALDPAFTALTESDPAYKVLQVCIYREVILRQDFNDRMRGMLLAYARGANLDHLGAYMGIERLVLNPGDPVLGIAPTLESDTDFRRRIQLAPEGFSVAGPEGAYVFHALSADPRVLDASATSPDPGDVVVTVLSREGDGAADPDLVASVANRLASDDVRPMTDHVTVQSATIVPYQYQATVYTFAGPDSAVVLAEAEAKLDAFIEDAHRLGRDIPINALDACLYVQGVARVNSTLTGGDGELISIDRTQAAYCTSVTVIYGGLAE